MLKPSNELTTLSMFVNQKPYLERSIKLGSYKNEERSKLIARQKHICPICDTALLDFNNLNILIQSEDNFLTQNGRLDDMTPSPEGLGPDFIVNHQISKSANLNLINKYARGDNWYTGLQIDHLVPSALGNGNPAVASMLENLNNKYLVHLRCHQMKTALDRGTIVKEFTALKKEQKKLAVKNNQPGDSLLISKAALKDLSKNKQLYKSYFDSLTNIYNSRISKSGKILFNKILKLKQ